MECPLIEFEKAATQNVRRSIFVGIVSDRLRVSRDRRKKRILRGEQGKRLEVTEENEDERRYIADQ